MKNLLLRILLALGLVAGASHVAGCSTPTSPQVITSPPTQHVDAPQSFDVSPQDIQAVIDAGQANALALDDAGDSGHRLGGQFVPPPLAVSGIPVFNVVTYGANGNGVFDNRTAINAADTAACAAGGGIVFFPAGTYEVSRQGVNGYAIQITCSNITWQGVAGGQSVLQLITGSTGTGAAAATDLLEVLAVKDVTIRDMVLDGNWGNAVTRIGQASNNQTLTGTYTLTVLTTTGALVGTTAFPVSGPYTLLVMSTAGQQTVTCTGKTTTTFTSCTGGSGVVNTDAQVALATTNTNTAGKSLNYTFDADPSSDALLIRGPTNLLVENVTIRNVYGDCWSNNGNNINHDLKPLNIRAVNVKCDLTARHGYNINSAYGLTVDHTYVTNIIGTGIFSQPFQAPVRDVSVEHSYFGPGLGAQTSSVGIDGGGSNGGWTVLGATLRNWRFVDNTFLGGVSAVACFDLLFTGNHSVLNYINATSGKSNFLVELGGGDITIRDNWLYNKTANSGLPDGNADTAGITLYNYVLGSDGAGTPQGYCPASLTVANNKVRVSNGRSGILLLSPGCLVHNATGTATSVTDTTVVDTGATWVDHQFRAMNIHIGTAWGAVADSTGCPTSVTVPGSPCTITLTLQTSTTTTGWSDFYGAFVPTPSVGTYVIHMETGVADISSNSLNMADDGNGPGGPGVWLTSSTNDGPGMRVRVHDNKIQNADDTGIYLNFGDNIITFPFVDISNNYGWDDQATPTFLYMIKTNDHQAVSQWIMGGNITGENVAHGLAHTHTASSISSATDQIGFTRAHQLSTGQGPIHVFDTATYPSPLTAGTDYYAINVDSTHIKLATSQANALAGTAVNITTNGTGTFNIITLDFAPGSWWTRGSTGEPACMMGYPAANDGTLTIGSTNCVGNITGLTGSGVTLTFSGTWPHPTRCFAMAADSGGNQTAHIYSTDVAPTTTVSFVCEKADGSTTVTCPNFNYKCESYE